MLVNQSRKYILLLLILFLCFTNFASAQQTNFGIVDSLITAADSININERGVKTNLALEALAIAERIDYPLGEAAACNILGKIYYFFQDMQKSYHYFHRALIYFNTISDSVRIAELYSAIGNVFAKKGETDSSLTYHQISYQIFTNLGLINDASSELFSIGSKYLSTGQYEQAEKYLFRTMKLREKHGDSSALATTYNTMGVLNWRMGRLQSAMNYYELSIALREKLNDLRGQIYPRLNIGLIFILLMDYDYSEQYLRSGLDISNELDHVGGKAIGNLYLAELFFKKGIVDSSVKYANRARKIYYKINYMPGKVRASVMIAQNYITQGSYDAAENILKKGLINLRNFKDSQLLPEIYYSLADLEYHRKNYIDAEKYVSNSLSCAKPTAAVLKNIYLLSANIYDKLKAYKKSTEYFKQYTTLNDSIFNKHIVEIVSNWSVKYKTAVMENEIRELNVLSLQQQSEIESQVNMRNWFILVTCLILIIAILLSYLYYQKKNLVIQIKNQRDATDHVNEKLKALNGQKDKMLSIIGHDLKNPAGSLRSFLEFLHDDYDTMDDQERRSIIKESYAASKKLTSLLLDLLEWGKLTRGLIELKIKEFNLTECVEGVFDLLGTNASQKNIRLERKDCDQIFKCDEYMLSTALRNLVDNAIKFSPIGGTVLVSYARDNNYHSISIIDSGEGIDEEKLKDLFRLDVATTTTGTADETGSGLGLPICKEFVERCGGHIKIESEVGKGSNFIVSLPINH